MSWACPECRVALVPSDEKMAPPKDLNELIAVDRGGVFRCPGCGEAHVLWNGSNLAFKGFMALFSLWLAPTLIGSGLLALSMLLGLPEHFGYRLDTPVGAGTWILAALVGLGGGRLLIYAYPLPVFRQFRLRWRLRAAAKGIGQP